jgi:hypothetical protein
MEDAWKVFNKIPSACGCLECHTCAIHGHGKEALEHFEQIFEEGVQADDITFLCLLSACRCAGLVDEAICCCASMITEYMISTKLEHYTAWLTFLAMLGIYRRQRM